MTIRHAIPFAMAAAVGALALPAQAQFAKADDAIKYRQSVMFAMSQHFGRLGAMANGRIPFDAKAAADNADAVAYLLRMPWPGFMPGTDKGSTSVKPEIWSDAAKFRESAEKSMADTAKLATAARAGNVESLKAAFGPTAGSCKGCHDAFRKD